MAQDIGMTIQTKYAQHSNQDEVKGWKCPAGNFSCDSHDSRHESTSVLTLAYYKAVFSLSNSRPSSIL